MKILISADMEGITGITSWDQVTPGHPEYLRFRPVMTADVNAAVRGAMRVARTTSWLQMDIGMPPIFCWKSWIPRVWFMQARLHRFP